MNQHKPTLVTSLRRIVFLATSVLLLVGTLGTGATVHAATPTPTPTPTNTKPAPPKGAPTPAAPILPPNAPKPGVKPAILPSRLARQAAAPATAASASLPTTTCTVGACDLWALNGTIQVAGAPTTGLPIWGFSTSAAGPAQIPGPNLIVNETENITITLHNQLQVTRPDGRPEMVSLEIPAAQVQPDTAGRAPGQTQAYHFGKLGPGTYLYQAGPTADAPRQIRMGLAGLLIVRPKLFAITNSAYGGNLDDGFTAEATAVLNEFDPEFNAQPFKSDPIDYHASLFLLNGRTFDPANPTLGKIDVGNTDHLLLRYANLGSHDRGVTVENQRQRVLADDSHVLKNLADVATKWLTPGQVSDAFIDVNPGLQLGTQIPIFESGYHFNNGPSLGLGGALSYLDVVKGLGGSASGPVTQVTVSPLTNSGLTTDTPERVQGTITPTTGSVTAAEWFLDDVGQPGTGNAIPMPLNNNAFDFTISQTQLNALLATAAIRDGDHVIWVHGQDQGGTPPQGTWGVVSGDVFTYNATGPDTSAITVHVSPTNGARFTDVANGAGTKGADKPTTDVVVLGTFASSLSDWVVLGGEYCMDDINCTNRTPVYVTPPPTQCPSGSTMDAQGKCLDASAATVPPEAIAMYKSVPDGCVPPPPPPGVNAAAPGDPPGGGTTVSFCGVVPTSVLNSLPEGEHKLYFHACEAPNKTTSTYAASCRWGDFNMAGALTKFVVDKHGPAASDVVLDPDPNNGTVNSAGNLNFLDSLQVTATLDDSKSGNSVVSYGEVFLTNATVSKPPDAVIPASKYGTGAEMIPTNAKWDSPTKIAHAYVPLAELTSYPEGLVRFWVHSRDIAGNWGDWSYSDLKLDRTKPKFNYGPGQTPADGSQIGSCATSCTITVDATDPVSSGVQSKIVQAEWFVDQGAHLICEQPAGTGCTPEVVAPGDPGFGNSTTPIPITTPGYSVTTTFNTKSQPPGTKIVFRVKDAAGNWSVNTMVVTQ